jgi:hypothetical protein
VPVPFDLIAKTLGVHPSELPLSSMLGGLSTPDVGPAPEAMALQDSLADPLMQTPGLPDDASGQGDPHGLREDGDAVAWEEEQRASRDNTDFNYENMGQVWAAPGGWNWRTAGHAADDQAREQEDTTFGSLLNGTTRSLAKGGSLVGWGKKQATELGRHALDNVGINRETLSSAGGAIKRFAGDHYRSTKDALGYIANGFSDDAKEGPGLMERLDNAVNNAVDKTGIRDKVLDPIHRRLDDDKLLDQLMEMSQDPEERIASAEKKRVAAEKKQKRWDRLKKVGAVAKDKLKGAFSSKSVHVGPLGDESGFSMGRYAVDRSGDNVVGAGHSRTDKSFTTADGTRHTHTGDSVMAGLSYGGNYGTYNARTADGATIKCGASQSAWVGAKADDTLHAYTGSTSGFRKRNSFAVGTGHELAAASSIHKDLGNGFGERAQASMGTSFFAGLRGSSNARVEKSLTGVAASAGTEAFYGVESTAEGGAETGLSLGSFDLLAARAKAKGRVKSGVEVRGNANVSASLLGGLQAGGGAHVSSGQYASGSGSVGASVGGVDGDLVAKGTAMTGAEANASGSVALGPRGAKLSAALDAFAGAKAEGEVGMEVGAAGLNLARIAATGKVMAGAGANANLDISVMDGDAKAGAEAGVSTGVGAGAGMKFKADIAFVPRLLMKEAKANGIEWTRALSTAAVSALWTLRNGPPIPGPTAARTRKAAVAPGSDGASAREASAAGVATGSAGSAAASVAGRASGLPAFESLGGGLGPDLSRFSSVDDAKKSLGPDGASLLDHGVEDANAVVSDAITATVQDTQATVNEGMALLNNIGPILTDGFSNAERAHAAAAEQVDSLIGAAVAEGGGMADTLETTATKAMAELKGLITLDPTKLLEMDWEAQVAEIRARVLAFVDEIRQGIVALIDRTQQAVAEVGLELSRSAALPLRTAADGIGAVIARFGGKLTSNGLSTVARLERAFALAESGVPVAGLPAALALPHEMTPMLSKARSALGEGDSWFKNAAAGALGDAVDDVADEVGKGLFEDAPKKVADFGKGLLSDFDNAQKAVLGPLDQTVSTVTKAVAPIVNGAQQVAKAVSSVVGGVGDGAKHVANKVGETVDKVGGEALKAVKNVGDGIAKAAKGAFGWLFG